MKANRRLHPPDLEPRMERLTAKDFQPELLELYDFYVHGQISRRDFLDRASTG